MKKIFFLLFALAGLSFSLHAQTDIPAAKPGVQYGKKITKDHAISVEELTTKLESDSTYQGKITGEVTQVCLSKGCFIRLKREGSDEDILVRFKDYEFFMPEDIVGRTIVLEGEAAIKETTVAWLKHYAEDEGKSAEEIAKITEPSVDINIIADGVLIVK